MTIKLMNKYIFFTIILIFLSLQLTTAFLFNQDVQAEQSQITTTDNVVLEFFYSDSCPSCIQKEPIIDEIEQYYGDKITISRLRYTENKEKFDDYGFKYLPAAVVKNTSSGYYTLFTFERITKENIKESIDFHVSGEYIELSDKNDSSNYRENKLFSNTFFVLIFLAGISIFILFFLFFFKKIKNKKIFCILVSLILIILSITCLYCPYEEQPVDSSETNFFEISKNQKTVLLNYAYDIIDAYFKNDLQQATELPKISFEQDYERLYITILKNSSIHGCQSGSNNKTTKNRVYLDISEAVVESIEDDRFGNTLEQNETQFVSLVFTFMYNKKEIKYATYVEPLESLNQQIALGINAIEIKSGNNYAYYKESVPITSGYDLINTLKNLCLKAGLPVECYTNQLVDIYTYDTTTFLGYRTGEIIDLYRYNILLDEAEIDTKMLLSRLSLAQNWFINNTNEESSLLEYEYYPSLDYYSNDNNHVRQIASTWAASTLQNFLTNNKTQDLIKNTFDYYLTFIEEKNNYAYLNISNNAPLAYNAFMILGLVETRDYSNRMELLKKFAKGIISLQQEDGSYNTNFLYNSTSGINFYPGEAMLSLMRLYQETKNTSYLDSVQKAYGYYTKYWIENKNTAFIPWHTQAYKILYEETQDSDIPIFIFEMNDWIVQYQITNSTYPDERGGFPKTNPAISTSTYLEGINDAYAVAKMINDTEHMQKYYDTIKKGSRFIMQLQFTENNSFYLKNKSRVIGGFRYSLIDNKIRNDFTQHSVSALIKAYEYKIFV